MVVADLPLAGIAAVLAALGGFLTAIVGIRRAREEGAESCHDALNACREESEKYARQLHAIRLKHPELDDGRASVWMMAAVGLFAIATALAFLALGIGDPSPGPPGPPGPIGPVGPAGSHGLTGPQGTTATTVIVVPGTGTNTSTGDTGSAGSSGAVGATGGTGATGTGETGASGATGAAGPPGAATVGPPGPAGPPGAAGATGARGAAGPPGPVQSTPVCPSGFALQTVELKEKNQTVTAALCVAQ